MKLIQLLVIFAGILCLFFPGLIIFGFGLEHWMDYVMVVFLTSICVFIIYLGVVN